MRNNKKGNQGEGATQQSTHEQQQANEEATQQSTHEQQWAIS